MGFFDSIRDAIFGGTQAAAQPTVQDATGGTAQQGAGSAMPDWAQNFGQAAPAQAVDVEAVLREKMAAKGNPDLNYQSSIVDLLKLLDLDSSLASRSQLAEELGYTGAKDGSAEMNIWLHRKVMEELERHGGRVPEAMKA